MILSVKSPFSGSTLQPLGQHCGQHRVRGSSVEIGRHRQGELRLGRLAGVVGHLAPDRPAAVIELMLTMGAPGRSSGAAAS
jgi:hypothetical protein